MLRAQCCSRWAPAGLLGAALTLPLGGCIRREPAQPVGAGEQETSAPALDRFGVRMLWPTLPGGLEWHARWDAPARQFSGRDPADAWFDADHGQASYRVGGDGTLRISGSVPRMYVHDPALQRQWRNVEITMYFQRVADGSVPWGGMVSVARTNHGTTGDEAQDKCDTRGLGARMRYDGAVDFEKETNHPASEPAARKPYWSGGMPLGRWIGYKHVVYDTAAGRVRQELWIDAAEARDGGQWQLLNQFEDDGSTFGAHSPACRDELSSSLVLSNAPERAGSESGKPNLTVYFRSDEVGPDGLWYKWGSVREIAPLASLPRH